MILEVIKYGNKVLREKAVPVVSITKDMLQLAEDMLETMYKTRGVGLAAQQVNRTESVCVIDVPPKCEDDEEIRDFNSAVQMPLVMFNPIILSTEGSQEGNEGCLSFPGIGGKVTRPNHVTVQYTDINGLPVVITVKGFLARAVLHETDHLNGILYVDHMSAVDKLELGKKLLKLANKNGGNL